MQFKLFKNRGKSWLAALGGCLALSSCAGGPPARGADDLTGQHWTLVTLNTEAPSDEAFIKFHETGKFQAFAGCNQIGGRYERKMDSMRFFEIVSTRKACKGNFTEAPFLQALREVNGISESDEYVRLLQDDDVRLRFERQALAASE